MRTVLTAKRSSVDMLQQEGPPVRAALQGDAVDFGPLTPDVSEHGNLRALP